MLQVLQQVLCTAESGTHHEAVPGGLAPAMWALLVSSLHLYFVTVSGLSSWLGLLSVKEKSRLL